MLDTNTMTASERYPPSIGRKVTLNQIVKVSSLLLVPLMITVFTIVTTVLQMNLAQQEREQDLHIAKENREKDFEIANQTRILQNEIEESRRTAETNAQKSQQMNIVLADYLKDMAELMLSRNFTLEDQMIVTVIRAKTFTTLGQLDGKRKGHLVRFLYEGQMINVEGLSIDLRDADLSDLDLTNYKLVDASFAESNLAGAIFQGTTLQNINFTKADLTNTSFIGASLDEVNFYGTTITDANFTDISTYNPTWFAAKGDNTIFNRAVMRDAIFTQSTLTNAKFVGTRLVGVFLDRATLVKANFTDADLKAISFASSNLSGSIFDRSKTVSVSFSCSILVETRWTNTVVRNVDFSRANLSNASITDNQIQRAWKTFDIIFPNGQRGNDTNLLENGDAEGQNGQCETSPWIVNSMIAVNDDQPIPYIFGQCYFATHLNSTEGRMWQRVRVPSQYDEWIRTNMAFIWIGGICVSFPVQNIFRAVHTQLGK